MNFPVYRKLSNNKVFYKINSMIDFEEIQLIGKKAFRSIFKANQYPEKLKIMDMIANESPYENSTSEEWNEKNII